MRSPQNVPSERILPEGIRPHCVHEAITINLSKDLGLTDDACIGKENI